MKYTYFLINIFSFIVPFLFSFYPKINFYKRWKTYFPAMLISATIFIVWDIYFTKMGVWQFNPDFVLGIYFFNLPLEEVLFFLCIPYACVFTYHCLSIYPKIKLSASLENGITVLLILFLVLTAIFNLSRIYTSVTFISLSVLLITTKYFLQREWLGKFYIVYLVLLLPFLIVNGLLTGTGLPEPVVIYNNLENLGFRIFTIPFEDVFYGMCLILLNVLLYEWFETQPATK